MELPNKKYKIIYADPAWSYSYVDSIAGGRGQNTKYPCMRCVDIFDLSIQNICDTNCVLFLWATPPMLPEAIFTIKNWGFIYKTIAFVWIKTNSKNQKPFFGMGQWTRSNSEICLLGIKGKPKRIDKSISQVIISSIEEHSKKPNEVYTRIEKLMGDIPRIELFARYKREGWDVWGNEAPNFTQLSLPSADGDIIIANSNKIKDFTSDSASRTFANAKES